MTSSLRKILGTFTGLALAGGVALAQGDTSPDKKELLQQKVAAIKESIAQNQASLRQYTWTAHTEISVKGEVKNEKDESCKYGPDGKVVKTLTSAPPPEKQMGRAKKEDCREKSRRDEGVHGARRSADPTLRSPLAGKPDRGIKGGKG